jgi:hypothetical protein
MHRLGSAAATAAHTVQDGSCVVVLVAFTACSLFDSARMLCVGTPQLTMPDQDLYPATALAICQLADQVLDKARRSRKLRRSR